MTIAMRDIFEKPVDRSIDGVIKADDEASLRVELDEYVITGEIGLRLGQFLEAYNNYSTANGVWISGFFGSGKSHLLKMLALLLENREVDGVKAFDIFAQKDELKNDPMLAGALRKAISIPSKSILFNIDQKADVISKTDVDALLAVFQKVFDEMCGYYGKQPHIAQFERQLDERGQFDAFKAAFLELSGKPWETRGREEALLESRNIAAAFARATGTAAADAKDILTQYRKDTRVSIEDFANTVKAWIDRQVPKFRLNLFVDEVGQYIADNVKLMTNLQTIAESLNTKCKGQAWIIVTAQQALTDVVGDMTARQENDFSKIQARFSNRMPLNSADVAEVIQKRLLAKTDAAEITLGNLHDKEVSNLRTLFDFTDGSIPLKNYRDRNHFIASYPFPPYQYTLFQMAITSLSEHNAFEGKHSSVGERSMLGVFQEVAKALKDMPVGGLATFDRMFDGIQSVLKSSVQQSIHIAKDNLDDPYAFRVLKALFLVKYVKGFRATVRNISILLLSEFDVDQGEQRRRIEEALARLERETYIQRNGDVYEFLTNEEKDVEAEIKALDVDPAESTKALEDLAFDTILRHRKIKHLTTGYEYAFSRKLDDHLLGREYELSINIISPVGDDIAVPETVRMRNLGREELAVVLQPDVRFVRDLRLFRQTDKYIRQARTGSPQPGRDRIIQEKGDQNARRAKDLEARLRKLIVDARLFVRGDELDIGGDEPQERIVKAFQSLIDKVYVNLPMLRQLTYQESDIAKAASLANDLLGDTGLKEEEQEVLNYIQGQARNGVKVSVKYLTERFGAKPYGWPTVATLCLTASLVAKGKCEARSDGAPLEGASLARALNNSHQLGNILLTPQVEFLPSQIRAAKDLYRELFGQPADGSDARVLGGEWADSASKLAHELKRLLSDKRNYPFLVALEPLRDRIADMTGKPPAWYITEPVKQEDALLNAKEDILDKIRSFMAGAQKEIYDDVRDFLRSQEANIGYVDASAGEKLRATLNDPDCYKGNIIQSLKSDVYALKDKVELDVLKERKAVIAAVDGCAEKIAWTPEFQALAPEQQEKIRRSIETHKAGIEAVSMIPILRDRANGARTGLMQQILADIARITPPPAAPDPTQPGYSEPPASAITPPTYINATDVKVAYPRTYLAEEADVDQYVNELRKTLIEEIRAGKRVIV
ncbi:BREX system P-loop protein BrxC [Rhizobium ruizarguesonis]|uniref:BREX system P-loop protein BrxC n=1 Tax=Rhizobium ruizarguesonis TaxID=2081791 RepID=UPI001038A79D|nr:BREX system P-loop protein BrxC [Rhizobium ruizarguesonis]MBY5806103.1 BREX system P-loop protein BrxC [Rhizobium leguminosarum]TCB12111.1 BREX system P-loop protein BrxC [Rhizobium leguminosarum bv. viciae]MBY5846859.1 BREX system P-loop protein BrxC [Rhizobium leguminosarum]NEH87932.1 BREX system P-loop protein BrxC [Rhizobium ruizarguesonis]NEJ58071.1 BREX system P-loop protein BrxC [Rhizobium ruizarguesonis]